MSFQTIYLWVDTYYYYLSWYMVIFLPFFIFYSFKAKSASNRLDEFREFGSTLLALMVITAVKIGTSYIDVSPSFDISHLHRGIQLLFFIIVQDFYFFVTHYYLHNKKKLFKLHWTHHNQKKVTPYTTFSLSIGEALIQFGYFHILSLFIENSIGDLFTAFAFAWSLFLHMDFNYPGERLMRRFFVTNKFHIEHHQKLKMNYGLYFVIWDRFLEQFQSNRRTNEA